MRKLLLAIGLVLALPLAAADGLNLAVAEWGNPAGKPVLLLHGSSFATHVWQQQKDPALAARYRFVSLDLRGHGASDQPARPENYSQTQVWADDVAAVMAARQLDKPVIVAWSFGGDAAINYVRHYGRASLAGILFVADAADSPVPEPLAFNRHLIRFIESTRATDEQHAALAIVRGFLDAHNRHEVDAAVAFYHDDASFALSNDRGVVTGREGLLELERLDAQLGSWLSPHGLRVRREGEETIVSLDYVVEQSDIAQAVGVPLIVAEAVPRAFVIRDGRFRRVEQPRFAPPCARAMGSGFMGFIAWMNERADPRRDRLLRRDGGIVLTAATAPLWIAGIREWRSQTSWAPNEEDVLACARYEPLPVAASAAEPDRS